MEWANVLQAVEGDRQDGCVSDAALQNLVALVKYGAAELLPPSKVGQGYYRSAVLDWGDHHKQIEVFEDRFEFYDFSEVPIAIHYVEVAESDQLPDQLVSLLGPLKG